MIQLDKEDDLRLHDRTSTLGSAHSGPSTDITASSNSSSSSGNNSSSSSSSSQESKEPLRQGRYISFLPANAKRPLPLPGFPSLTYLSATRDIHELNPCVDPKAKINVFGRDSRKASLVFQLSDKIISSCYNGAQVATRCPSGSTVVCDYPFIRIGQVTKVMGRLTIHTTHTLTIIYYSYLCCHTITCITAYFIILLLIFASS